MKFLKLFFKKLKKIPEENKVLYAKIDELNAAVRLIIEVWLGFMRRKRKFIGNQTFKINLKKLDELILNTRGSLF